MCLCMQYIEQVKAVEVVHHSASATATKRRSTDARLFAGIYYIIAHTYIMLNFGYVNCSVCVYT